MRSKAILQLVAAAFILGLALLSHRAALGQCGGYCQSSSYCPATGYGCSSGLCCYCCERCTTTVCGYQYVCTLPSNPPQNVYRKVYYQNLWYNCYQGPTCTYWRTANDRQCNGNCVEPVYC